LYEFHHVSVLYNLVNFKNIIEGSKTFLALSYEYSLDRRLSGMEIVSIHEHILVKCRGILVPRATPLFSVSTEDKFFIEVGVLEVLEVGATPGLPFVLFT
jgi:hypothetical protein